MNSRISMKTRNAGIVGTVGSIVFMLAVTGFDMAGVITTETTWTLFLALGVIPATLFIVTYAWRVPRWRKSVEGRHMMFFTALIDVLMIEELATRIFGRQDWHGLFLAFAIGAIVLVLWQRYAMLLMAQRNVHADRDRLRYRSEAL